MTNQELFLIRGTIQDAHDIVRGVIDAIDVDGEQYPERVCMTASLFLNQAAQALTLAMRELEGAKTP
jgi:hypothetical protein